ncbi:MAG: metallophosphoesterase family protein [Gaiellaceae bacterium]|jgi:putative phosphoesterase
MGTVRVVCLSDTHLRRRQALPAWCLRRLEGADLILHVGDMVAAAVLDELEQLAPVEAVRGNMDEIALRERLPVRRVVEIAAARIGLVHDPGSALGRATRLEQSFLGCDAVVFGHTHVPEIQRHARRLILNPGSPTAPRSTLGATMLELSVLPDGTIEPVLVTP